jgi:hypothetical protein
MANKTSTLSVALRATAALFGNLPVVLPLAAVLGLCVASLDILVFNLFQQDPVGAGAAANQSTLIKVFFGWWGVVLLVEVFLGPILVGMSIYAARTYTHGGKATLYKALNFALARYTRIFKWHAIAWLIIQVGMIALIPGILFLLQYAFVDSVLCLEDERWPLARSTKLTKGRRGRIFALAMIWMVTGQVVGFLELAVLSEPNPVFALTGVMSAVYLVNIWLIMVFYMFYEDRTKPA